MYTLFLHTYMHLTCCSLDSSFMLKIFLKSSIFFCITVITSQFSGTIKSSWFTFTFSLAFMFSDDTYDFYHNQHRQLPNLSENMHFTCTGSLSQISFQKKNNLKDMHRRKPVSNFCAEEVIYESISCLHNAMVSSLVWKQNNQKKFLS